MTNPDLFPWQVGLPLAGLLWGYLIADAVARRLRRERQRVEEATAIAKANTFDVQGSRVDAAEAAAASGVGAGDRRGDSRVAGRRWSVVAAGLAVALAGLTACSAIDSGIVTDKHAKPGYMYTTTSCRTVNKTTTCTQSPVWMPPSWTLDLRDGEKTGWARVSESTYAQYEVGEVYP